MTWCTNTNGRQIPLTQNTFDWNTIDFEYLCMLHMHPNENFDKDHPDRSSGALETCEAGNATMDILHRSYIARETEIQFPKPFVLQIGNDAALARIFAMDVYLL